MKQKPQYIVYALIDGKTGQRVYIGQTTQPIKARLQAHINSRLLKNAPLQLWLQEMVNSGQRDKILIEEIATAKTKKGLNSLERKHIKELLKNPHCLNGTTYRKVRARRKTCHNNL